MRRQLHANRDYYDILASGNRTMTTGRIFDLDET